MKQLTDADIEKMGAGEFQPDYAATRVVVRENLHLARRMPPPVAPTPEFARIDLHNCTVEQAWTRVYELANSGVRRAVVITGASGVLKTLFQSWATDSLISPRIISFAPINNGSFSVHFRRMTTPSD